MAKKKETLGFVLIRLPSEVHKSLKVLCAQKELTMQHVINSFPGQIGVKGFFCLL